MTPTGPSTVAEIMTGRVVAAKPDASLKNLVRAMRSLQVGCLPVIDDDGRVLGVVSEDDLFDVLAGRRSRRRSGYRARDLMSAPAVTVNRQDSLAEAATKAVRTVVHRLPVVDDDGRLIGLVSRTDLLQVYLRPDDAIRDEILQRVIQGEFALDPYQLDVQVCQGIVYLNGQLERPTLVPEVLAEVDQVTGVVGVESHLRARTAQSHPAPAP